MGAALVGCAAPDRGADPTARASDPTTETRSTALTTSLFQPFVAYATGAMPQAVAIGDLDGDGRNDVALLTFGLSDPTNDNAVHVFLQATDGSLKPRVKYPVGVNGISMDIGDVNGDGRADVVVGLSGAAGPKIGVLLQNAAGTLNPMVSYPTANSYQVKIGDFNGDGLMDIAGINFGARGDGLDVFLQTAGGTLAAPVTYHVPHGGYDELDAGDIDGDGRTDLVVMSGQLAFPNLNVLLQMPDGTLGAPTSYSLGGGLITRGVALGDANGDGRPDIVVSYGGNKPTSFIARFLQNAGGGMDPPTSYPSLDIPSAIVLADVDGDGRKDALVTHDGWNKLGVYRQFPSADFLAEELYPIGTASQYAPQALAVGDINGDGRPDAVIADSNKGLVVLRHVSETALALAVTAPASGTYYTGVPLAVHWAIGDTIALAGFDVSMSVNNGLSYTPLPGCTGLPSTATECPWTPTSPSVNPVRLRVTARNASGQTTFAETTFNLIMPSIGPSVPGSSQFVGTTTTVTWLHNLPSSGTVRVELTRDGASYETLADSVPISVPGSDTTGKFVWTVTGPSAAAAHIRVTSNSSVPAFGNTLNFAILTPTMTVTAPAAGATAYTTSPLSVAWTTNVNTAATVRVELSRDGGATFQTLAASAPNTGAFTAAVSGPSSANAVVRVTTNGSLATAGTSGSFTLAVPTVAVTIPAAGGACYAGTPLAITWTSNLPSTSTATVELSVDGGNTFGTLATNLPSAGRFAWIVMGPDTGAALVRVTVGGPGATSATSGLFAILNPSLMVTGPVAGAPFYAGIASTISWVSNLPATSPVVVELSRDGGGTFETLAAGAPNTGGFAWVVTAPDTTAAVVRVTVTDPVVVSSTSGAFAITTPLLTVTGPPAGTLAYAGTPLTITWTDNVPDVDPVTIELSRDGGASFETLAAAAPDTGSFDWVVTGPDAAEALVRVTSGGAGSASGVGPAFQIVTPVVAVTSPGAGENWAVGTDRTIAWSSNLPADATVLVELSRDGGASFAALASGQPASGSLTWTAAAPETGAAIIRVSAEGSAPAVGTSGAFAIGAPAVTVTSPAAGASWTIGTAQAITWSTNLLPGATVKVQISRNGGGTYSTLASAAPNTGSFAWTAAGAATTNAIVRVTANGFAATGLGGAFSLVAGKVTVTSPNTLVTWSIGSVQPITWSHNFGADAQFEIEVSRGGIWSVIAPAVPATDATSGRYDWTVAGPATSNAKVRVTWTGGTVKDTSDVSFRIR